MKKLQVRLRKNQLKSIEKKFISSRLSLFQRKKMSQSLKKLLVKILTKTVMIQTRRNTKLLKREWED